MEKEKEKDNGVYVDIRRYIYIRKNIQIDIYVCVDLSYDMLTVQANNEVAKQNIESDHMVKYFPQWQRLNTNISLYIIFLAVIIKLVFVQAGGDTVYVST